MSKILEKSLQKFVEKKIVGIFVKLFKGISEVIRTKLFERFRKIFTERHAGEFFKQSP